MNILNNLKDRIIGKIPAGSKRSSQWNKVKTEHLKTQPVCVVCGTKKKLQVHHKMPFHINPELELDPKNLITLCESSTHCHLNIGHLQSFRSYNPIVEDDAKLWSEKIKNRP